MFWYVDKLNTVKTNQVALYLGPDFVVTVRHGEGNELSTARRDLESHATLLGHGPSAVLYAVTDRIVDSYEEVMRGLETDVDEVEESVFSPIRTRDSRRIYVLKRELAEVRRAVMPLRLPVQQFASGSVSGIVPESAPFFRDVADHLARTAEQVETLDALLSTAFEAHLARVQVEQNEDMRKISAWVAIAAVSTLIAGVYGMNFHNMPELRWHYGYYIVLTVMGVASVVLYRLFRKYHWL
jgi:magnesium transporter